MRRRTDVTMPEAVRHFLLTGEHPSGRFPGGDVWWQLMYGPFGITRAEKNQWNRAEAFEPYRAALRAEGLQLPIVQEIDGEKDTRA